MTVSKTKRNRPYDVWLELQRGNLGGAFEDQKFGSVELLDAADAPSDIWQAATDTLANNVALKTFPTSATSFFIASDSSTDSAVDVTIGYIDVSGSSANITVGLNGEVAVDTSAVGFDVNRAFVDGSVAAVGNIYIAKSSAFTAGVPDTLGDTVAFIAAGDGQTQQSLYTVPSGKKCYLRQIHIDVSRGGGLAGSAIVDLRVRESGKAWVVKRRFYATTNAPTVRDLAGVTADGLANIAVRVTDISDNNTNVACSFNYVLVDA